MKPLLDRVARLLCLSPTALCEEHEQIHRARPAGDEARAALRRLRWWRPLLWILPTLNNIRIRHLLTVAGLEAEVYDRARFKVMLRAMRLFNACTDGGKLPHIEGVGYARYLKPAVNYAAGAGLSTVEFERELAAQEVFARARAMPSGKTPDHDTRQSEVVEPDTADFFTCEAFTVSRRGGRYVMVQHDARIRGWRFRWNLHVGNSFGVVVREEADWPFWYPEEGWGGKRIGWKDIAWRLWCPRMKVLERTEERVVLLIGRKKRTILFG